VSADAKGTPHHPRSRRGRSGCCPRVNRHAAASARFWTGTYTDTELCRIDVCYVDFAHGHINVEDAKTEAGVRRVDLSPMLLDDLLAWRASLKHPSADSPFVPTRTGNRRDKDNINASAGPTSR
jgi:integrase